MLIPRLILGRRRLGEDGDPQAHHLQTKYIEQAIREHTEKQIENGYQIYRWIIW